MPIDPSSLDPNPIRELEAWLAAATDAGVTLPNAFALATADADGVPSVRFVLCHGLDDDGLRFYTNRASRKGRDLAVNPWAAAVFWWPALHRQARVSGPARLLDEATSLAYWRTRPRGSQLSALASDQGREIESRAALEALVRDLDARYPTEIPLPPTWGGYLLIPRVVELWESRPDRLHDRVEYRTGPDGSWAPARRLQP
jgi:pyridoxamine 5'-phosphate oxidase